MSYSFFMDLAITGLLVYAGWLFHQLIRKTIIIYAAKEKYLALYDLKKLEMELEKRKLSFEELDTFSVKFVKSDNPSKIQSIDDNYGVEPIVFEKKGKG